MKNKINLLGQLTLFKHGYYSNPSTDTQIKAGWYDWFCKDSSLAKKTESLYKKVNQIASSKKIDLQKSYVFFKNNCPMVGNLYDDFRICDIKSGDVIFTVVPRSGHKSMNGKGEIWGRENGFKEALFVGTWAEIKKWFNN